MCRGMRSSGSARTVPALLLSLNLPLLQAAGKGGKNRETGNSLGRLKAGFKSTSPVCALIGVCVFWSKKREWIPRWGSVSSGTGDYRVLSATSSQGFLINTSSTSSLASFQLPFQTLPSLAPLGSDGDVWNPGIVACPAPNFCAVPISVCPTPLLGFGLFLKGQGEVCLPEWCLCLHHTAGMGGPRHGLIAQYKYREM